MKGFEENHEDSWNHNVIKNSFRGAECVSPSLVSSTSFEILWELDKVLQGFFKIQMKRIKERYLVISS